MSVASARFFSRRLLLRGAVALPMMAGLGACQRPQAALRLGANLWPGYAPMRMIEELHRGPPMRVLDFHSTAAMLAAFRSGGLEMAALTLGEALLLVGDAPDVRAVLVFDISDGADVLLARPGIHRLQDLAGRRIGCESAALGAYLTHRALRSVGLSPTDVQLVSVRLSEGKAALLSGQLDALVTSEPVRSHLLARGAHALFSSRDIPGEVVDVLVVHERLMMRQERELRTLLALHGDAREQLVAAPDVVAQVIGERIEMDADQLRSSLSGMLLPDAQQSRRLLSDADALPATARRLAAVLREQRLLSSETDGASLFDGVAAWLRA